MHKYKITLFILFLAFFPTETFSKNDGIINILGNSRCITLRDENGDFRGFRIDIIKEILDNKEIEYRVIDNSFGDSISHYDIYMTSGFIGVDEENYNASRKYLDLNINYMVTKDKYVNSFDCLRGGKLITMKNSVVRDYLEHIGFSDDITSVSDFSEGLKLIRSGNYDAFVTTDEWTLFGLAGNDRSDLIIKNTKLPQLEMIFGVIKSKQALLVIINDGIEEIIRNGRYGEIYYKWFGLKNNRDISTLDYILFSIYLIFIVSLLFYIIILIRKTKNWVHHSSKLAKELSIAINAGNIAAWKYRIKSNSFHHVSGEIWFDEGISMEEFIKFLDSDSRVSYKEAIRGLLLQEAENCELTIRLKETFSKDAQYIKVSMSSVIKNKKVTKILCASSNITSKTYFNNKLSYEAQKFASVFNNVSIGLEYYDKRGKLIDINESALKMVGLTDKNTVLAYKRNFLNDSFYKGLINSLDDLTEKKVFDIRYDMKNIINDYGLPSSKNGEKYFHVEVVPYRDSKNNLKNIIVAAYDFTENIRLNHKYQDLYIESREMFQSIPELLSIYDSQGNLTYVNGNLDKNKTLKIDSNDVIGKFNLFKMLQYFNKKIDFDKIDDYFEDDFVIAGHDAGIMPYHFTGEEEIIYFKIRIKPIRNTKGEIIKYISVASDITELIKARKKAEQSDLLKSIFLANMSHEIRTPLNAIVGFSELLQNTEVGDEKAVYGEVISHNSDILINLINDILDLSKIEAGFLEFKDEMFDLNKLFDETYTSFILRINEKIKLHVIKPENEISIYMDKKRFSQILYNYLSNASKYTMQGTIEFGYEVIDGGIKVYVKDTGIGIKEENKSSVFKRFQKFDEVAQGTGLGLSICKALTDVKKGKIGFASEYGVGSEFWAWIPCSMEINKTEEILIKSETLLN